MFYGQLLKMSSNPLDEWTVCLARQVDELLIMKASLLGVSCFLQD